MNPAHDITLRIAKKITLPDIYHRIRDLINKPDVKIDDFVETIHLDSALTNRIIKIANSSFFGYQRKARTLKQAISLIGVLQLHDILLSSLAIRAFSTIPATVVNQKTFWRSCIFCGITSKLLAKKCLLPSSERLFTSGLLHEIGHLVMYAQIPDQIQEIVMQSNNSNKPLFQLEREHLGFDYGQLGSEVMKLWHLPASYSEMSIYHIQPEKAPNNKFEIEIVNLARGLMLAEEQSPKLSTASTISMPKSLIDKKCTPLDLENIISQAKSYIDDVFECLWPFLPNNAKEDLFAMEIEN